MQNERISQILTCLYLLKRIVCSEGTIKYFTWSLHEFASRLFRNNNYNNNLLIKEGGKSCTFIKSLRGYGPIKLTSVKTRGRGKAAERKRRVQAGKGRQDSGRGSTAAVSE